MNLAPATPRVMPRGHILVSGPAIEPVTVVDLREHLSQTDFGLPDGEAARLIQEAREMIEEASGLALITQDWKLVLDGWPSEQTAWWDGVREGAISELEGHPASVDLPRWPLQSVQSVTVFDQSGTGTDVTINSTFIVDTSRQPGRIALQDGAVWPVETRRIKGVEITYRAGYGSSMASVPARVRGDVLRVASYLFTHKGDDCKPGDALTAASSMGSCARVKI